MEGGEEKNRRELEPKLAYVEDLLDQGLEGSEAEGSVHVDLHSTGI